MSKDLAMLYAEKDLMTRVDMAYAQFKQLEAEYEMSLVKHFNPKDKEMYKQNPKWQVLNEVAKKAYEQMREIESEMRVNGRDTN